MLLNWPVRASAVSLVRMATLVPAPVWKAATTEKNYLSVFPFFFSSLIQKVSQAVANERKKEGGGLRLTNSGR